MSIVSLKMEQIKAETLLAKALDFDNTKLFASREDWYLAHSRGIVPKWTRDNALAFELMAKYRLFPKIGKNFRGMDIIECGSALNSLFVDDFVDENKNDLAAGLRLAIVLAAAGIAHSYFGMACYASTPDFTEPAEDEEYS